MVSAALCAVIHMTTILSLKVKGMHCKSCAELIKLNLSKLNGVETAEASFPEETVKVSFDAETVSESEIKEELARLGYTPLSQNTAKPSPPSNVAKQSPKSSLKEGIMYGLLPHIGCIGFIAASVLGVTVAINFFRPLLLNPWFFYILIAISFVFATVSAALYLRKNGILSREGVARKKKYLATMYGSTVGINLLMFLVVFPMVANFDTGSFANVGVTGNIVLANANIPKESLLTLQVDIPCSGHAPLISGELKTISGVTGVKFRSPNYFDVAFDSTKTTKEKILSLEVFKTYKAKVVSESKVSSDNAAGLKETDSAANYSSLGTCNMGSSGGSGCGCSSCGTR